MNEIRKDNGSTMTELKRTKIIRRNSTNPSMNQNGGDYDFWDIIRIFHDEEVKEFYFLETHHTSAEFEYCRICGSFTNNCEHHWLSIDEENQQAMIRIDHRVAIALLHLPDVIDMTEED